MTAKEVFVDFLSQTHVNEMMDSRFTYIHQNPVGAGWVDKEDEYLYSSASNYTGLPAFIAVDWIGRVFVPRC